MPKVVVLGSGNVAFHLAKAFHSAGIVVIQIFGRNPSTTSELAQLVNSDYTNAINAIKLDADIYIFCMNDIANLAVANSIKTKKDAILVHTAGSQSMQIFNAKTTNFGVFYPFQTFTKGIKTNFSDVPICLEASNLDTYSTLENIAKKLECKTYKLDESDRETLHLTGVFAANFMNHCVSISEAILKENNIDNEIIKPLLKQSFFKLLNFEASNSQTGPAIREDTETIEKHLELLKSRKQYSEVYKVLTESIIEWKKKD